MDRNIKIKIAYDGTDYGGWQIQPNAKTIQEEIEKAIEVITKEKVNIIGSGRTDAGVHALGQIANFATHSTIPVEKFTLALNSILPDDIRINEAVEINEGFHARYDAKGKHYQYGIYNSKVSTPIGRQYHWNINYGDKLDLKKMRQAAKYFIGEHDFIGFMSTGSDIKTTVRTIYSIDISENGNEIIVDYKGNGFLYNMVRIITGTLVDCAIGKIEIEKLQAIIESKDRKQAGKTAPAKGLKLIEVFY